MKSPTVATLGDFPDPVGIHATGLPRATTIVTTLVYASHSQLLASFLEDGAQLFQRSSFHLSAQGTAMYYEDVTIRRGETIVKLIVEYGHKAADVTDIWGRRENMMLRAKRARHEDAQPGDVVMIPIPWVATTKINTVRLATATDAGGSTMIMHRDGGRGSQLAFVQTVNRDNQPIGPNPNAFCVDGCTPDDDRPFYWTQVELRGTPDRRKQFGDAASRNPPSAALGTTRWRAILSIAVVNRMRVTILEPTFWGFNITPATAAAPDGVITAVGPRDATREEIKGHLNLLKNGVGTSGTTFGKMGWTFREVPRLIGDFPTPSRELMYA